MPSEIDEFIIGPLPEGHTLGDHGAVALTAQLRVARLAAIPTAAEVAARKARGGEVPPTGISHAELAARVNEILRARGEPPTYVRETIARLEREGRDAKVSSVEIVAEALGLKWEIVPR